MEAREGMRAPIPEHVEYEATDDGFRLSFAWSRLQAVAALGGIPLMVFFFYLFKFPLDQIPSWAIAWFVLASAFALYQGIAMLTNRTYVELAQGRLTIRHAPIPSWGNRSIEFDAIQRVHRVDKSAGDNGTVHTLRVELVERGELQLLSGRSDVLAFLEHEIRSRHPRLRAATREPSPRIVDPRPPASTTVAPEYDVSGVARLTYRWWARRGWFLVAFAAFWDAFLVFWYSSALKMAPGHERDVQLLFPIMHIAAGIAITYVTLAALLNRGTVIVSDAEIRVRHKPIPWPGRSVPRHEIAQVYVENENEVPHPRSQVNAAPYKLHVVLKNGHQRTLISTLPSLEVARQIERGIEHAMGIPDRRVPGEADVP